MPPLADAIAVYHDLLTDSVAADSQAELDRQTASAPIVLRRPAGLFGPPAAVSDAGAISLPARRASRL